MSSFHDVDWVARRTLVEQLTDDRLQELGKRLIFVERPDVIDAVEKAELETWTMDRLFGFGPGGPRSLDESYQEVRSLIGAGGTRTPVLAYGNQHLAFQEA